MKLLDAHPEHPQALVSCDQVATLVQGGARLVQVDFDPLAFAESHIEGAVSWAWSDLRDPKGEDILSVREFEELMRASGLSQETPILLYGDMNNWFACWAFWILKIHGHETVRLVDGGLQSWIAEGHPVSKTPTFYPRSEYQVVERRLTSRATAVDVLDAVFLPGKHKLFDVRSQEEYLGLPNDACADIGVTCTIQGHIPTSVNVPWSLNCNPNGKFKSKSELLALYAGLQLTPEDSLITYCNVGKRASLSWFVLKELLGFPVVLNYDRSMVGYSKIPNAPIQSQKNLERAAG